MKLSGCASTFNVVGRTAPAPPKVVDSEPKQKIDWSRVSKPGDVLKAIQQRKDEAAAIAQRPPAPQASQPQAAQARSSSSSGSSRVVLRPAPDQPGPQEFPSRQYLCRVRLRARRRIQRSLGCTKPASAHCPNCAQSGFTRAVTSQSGWPRSASSRAASARAAKDRSPAPAGAADRSRPAARAGHCR